MVRLRLMFAAGNSGRSGTHASPPRAHGKGRANPCRPQCPPQIQACREACPRRATPRSGTQPARRFSDCLPFQNRGPGAGSPRCSCSGRQHFHPGRLRKPFGCAGQIEAVPPAPVQLLEKRFVNFPDLFPRQALAENGLGTGRWLFPSHSPANVETTADRRSVTSAH